MSLRADQEKERLKQMERDRILQQQLQEEAERMEQQRQKEVSVRIYRRNGVNEHNFNFKFT